MPAKMLYFEALPKVPEKYVCIYGKPLTFMLSKRTVLPPSLRASPIGALNFGALNLAFAAL
jgi:hypothetical protein